MALPLESFDTPNPPAPKASGPSPDYLRGLEDGRAAAEREHAAEQAGFQSEIIASLQDLGFGYTEARRHVLDALRPLLGQIATSIVPQALQEGFATELAEYLSELADRRSALPINLAVSPQNIVLMRPFVNKINGIALNLVSAETLGPGEAYWSTPEGEVSIDLGILSSGIREAIESLTDDLRREPAHG